MPVKLQIYSLELKTQAVRMAVEDGLGITETVKRLSIPESTLKVLLCDRTIRCDCFVSALKYPQVNTMTG